MKQAILSVLASVVVCWASSTVVLAGGQAFVGLGPGSRVSAGASAFSGTGVLESISFAIKEIYRGTGMDTITTRTSHRTHISCHPSQASVASITLAFFK